MQRRRFVQFAAAAGAALAAPNLASAADNKLIRFVPHADLTILDPTFSTTYITRNHGYLVFDTLFGQDSQQNPKPQMVAGATTEDDGKLWTLTLRPGLRFHDGEPVRARDCVASIRRWARRDDLGKILMSVTDELSARDDSNIVFRLKMPFPLLPSALGKTSLLMAAIMPERLASANYDTPVTEMVGSGPYRFVPQERIVGDQLVYERFRDYRPRENEQPDYTAGSKIGYFDRVEWKVITDGATAAAALQRGEIDWLEQPSADLVPQLRATAGIRIDILDSSGYVGILRLNQLYAPTNSLPIRRAMMAAIDQRDVVMALAGTDPRFWREGVGYFCPDTAFASDAGLEAMTSKRDPAAVKRSLEKAGYNGEKIVLMRPGDVPFNAIPTDVVQDNLARAGFNIDMVSMDWGTMSQRRQNRNPADQGGWGAYITMNSGTDLVNPAVHPTLRGDDSSNNGWFHDPALERLRQAWAEAPNKAEQVNVARQLQLRAFETIPYIPLGQVAQLTAFRSDLTGALKGMPVFWSIRRA